MRNIMKNTTITVWIPTEDFNYFLEVLNIVLGLPDLECDYSFRGKDIRMFTEKHMISSYQINLPILDFYKWTAYHNKNI